MKELGLDYKSVKEINPRIIMTSITPFGQSGRIRIIKAANWWPLTWAALVIFPRVKGRQ